VKSMAEFLEPPPAILFAMFFDLGINMTPFGERPLPEQTIFGYFYPMSSAPPPPTTAMPLPFFPSEKQICDPHHRHMATATSPWPVVSMLILLAAERGLPISRQFFEPPSPACAQGQVGCQKVARKLQKATRQFHPPARCHVFDTVLKHGWPSATCHGANMADYIFKPLHVSPRFHHRSIWH
jgi:hypothetical protein